MVCDYVVYLYLDFKQFTKFFVSWFPADFSHSDDKFFFNMFYGVLVIFQIHRVHRAFVSFYTFRL